MAATLSKDFVKTKRSIIKTLIPNKSAAVTVEKNIITLGFKEFFFIKLTFLSYDITVYEKKLKNFKS